MTRKRWRKCRTALLVFLALYVGLLAFGHIPDRIILQTNTNAYDAGAATQRLVPYDGGQLDVWVARSPGAATRPPEAYVLRFAGQGDRVDRWIARYAESFGSRPVEIWGMNYPGSGSSSGPAYLSRVGPAALLVYDLLAAEARGRPILEHAESLGTTAALCVAARRPIAGLILRNPPPLRQLVLGRFGWWNLWLLAGPAALQIPSDLDSIANAAQVGAPAVFLLSERDQVIPPQFQRQVVAAYHGPNRQILLRGALHNDPLDVAAETEYAADAAWLWTQVISRPPSS